MKLRHFKTLLRKYARKPPVILNHHLSRYRAELPFSDVVYIANGGALGEVECNRGGQTVSIADWPGLYRVALTHHVCGPGFCLGGGYSERYRQMNLWLTWSVDFWRVATGLSPGWDIPEDHELFWPLVDVMRGTECMEKFLDYAQITFPEMAPSIDRYLRWLDGRPITLE